MGYYCTVPQCTSLAGKTKNVKFHRFPRDESMADKWNVILKRGKPYTKYSKVCSLHFTQADYNVTAMGQWKTLSKDALPSKNLPKLNPDGSVMVIRKSRTVKYKEAKKDDFARLYSQSGKDHVASVNQALSLTNTDAVNAHHTDHTDHVDARVPNYHHQTVLAQNEGVPQNCGQKPKKQDAIMQTDPMSEEDEPQVNQSYSEASEASYNSENTVEGYAGYKKEAEYNKKEDYLPQTNEEYNKEAEKYALERKSHNSYEKSIDPLNIADIYYEKQPYPRPDYVYANGYQDSVELLRNQQHNLQILQDQHRATENQNFFHENAIKQEVDLKDDEKYIYERSKDQIDQNTMYQEQSILEQRLMEHSPVKQEPEVANGHENTMQPQASPFYTANGHTVPDYYSMPRPGPELLIAKQNALANMQLWQNAKRPYDISHFNGSQLFHKEDMQRILQ